MLPAGLTNGAIRDIFHGSKKERLIPMQAPSDAEVLVLVEVIRVKDEALMTQYQTGARQQLQARGGRVIARGGRHFFGNPGFKPLMIQRWPSLEKFEAWQASDDYAPLRKIRDSAMELRIAVIALIPN